MRYLALATDYDGTLASNDQVAEQTVHALERLKISGRRVILVTGRRLDDLLSVCSCPQLFDSVVAENGAIIYNPRSRKATRLANPPSKLLIQGLRARRRTARNRRGAGGNGCGAPGDGSGRHLGSRS